MGWVTTRLEQRPDLTPSPSLGDLLPVIRCTSSTLIDGSCLSHCQICEREIAVAASSIRLLIATAPDPFSHAARY